MATGAFDRERNLLRHWIVLVGFLFLLSFGAAPTASAQGVPYIEAVRFIRTTPFVNSSVQMKDGEGMAYVPVNNTLWLGEDNNVAHRIYEVDKDSGHLLSSIGAAELAEAVEFGGTTPAGLARATDIEALAYDPVNDVLYVFGGNCCPNPPTVFRLVRSTPAEPFQVETYQALAGSENVTAAAFHPSEGLYMGRGTTILRYDYESNSVLPASELALIGSILGMGFSEDGSDLWVVTSSDRLYRVNWATKRSVPGYVFNLAAQGISDGRAVEFIDGQLYILDGNRAPADVTRKFAATVFDLIRVAAPSDLTTTAASSSRIDLVWTDNAGNEDGFQIERCQGPGCINFELIATVGANSSSYPDTGLTRSEAYRYRVRAFSNTLGASAYSKTAGAITPPAFADVPADHWARPWIETLYTAGATGGCGAIPLLYCPDAPVTREQMAVFLLRSKEGAAYTPPACATAPFRDVPCGSPFAPWIRELVKRGVTAGCGGGNYCPGAPVTRQEVAVLLLKALEGPAYAPPTCTAPPFADVPCSSPFAPWIATLVQRGITAGCSGTNYCPTGPVTRAQIAVFLVRTFTPPF